MNLWYNTNMKSSWYDLKNAAILLRENGNSIRFIEKNLGIPRSTLSGWLKGIKLSDYQLKKLNDNRLRSLAIAKQSRINESETIKRVSELGAKEEANKVISSLEISKSLRSLSLALIYMNSISTLSSNRRKIIRSKDPGVLEYIVNTLNLVERIDRDDLKIILKLSANHSRIKEVEYWCKKLSLSPTNFTDILIDNRYKFDQRAEDHGECSIMCGNIALINKLVYLNKLFYERVLELGT